MCEPNKVCVCLCWASVSVLTQLVRHQLWHVGCRNVWLGHTQITTPLGQPVFPCMYPHLFCKRTSGISGMGFLIGWMSFLLPNHQFLSTQWNKNYWPNQLASSFFIYSRTHNGRVVAPIMSLQCQHFCRHLEWIMISKAVVCIFVFFVSAYLFCLCLSWKLVAV